MKGFYIFILCFILIGVLNSASLLKIDSIETSVVLSNTYSNTYYVQKSISIMHKRDATSFFIVATAGTSGDVNNRKMTKVSSGGNIDELSYQIINNMSDMNIVKDISGAVQSSDVLSGYFPQSNTLQYQTINFYYTVPAGQFVRSGLYSDSVKFELYQGDVSNFKRKNVSTVNLSTDIPVEADVVIVDRGGSFDSGSISKVLDMGVLEGGDSASCDVISRTNADGGYTIDIVSENSGYMTHISDITQLISYTMEVNGIFADLNAGFSETNPSQASALVPESIYQLDFIVEDPLPEVSPGDYRDVLTITLTALF